MRIRRIKKYKESYFDKHRYITKICAYCDYDFIAKKHNYFDKRHQVYKQFYYYDHIEKSVDTPIIYDEF